MLSLQYSLIRFPISLHTIMHIDIKCTIIKINITLCYLYHSCLFVLMLLHIIVIIILITVIVLISAADIFISNLLIVVLDDSLWGWFEYRVMAVYGIEWLLYWVCFLYHLYMSIVCLYLYLYIFEIYYMYKYYKSIHTNVLTNYIRISLYQN